MDKDGNILDLLNVKADLEHKMIKTVIVFQRINSVLPNKLMPNCRKAGW